MGGRCSSLRRAPFVSVLLLLAPGSARAVASEPEDAEAPYLVIRSSTATLAEDQTAGDVLVVDGRAVIRGAVRGHLFAIDSTVVLEPTAMVLSSLSVHGGALEVSPSAVLPSEIEAHGDVDVRGEAKVPIRRSASASTSLELMRWALPFDRFTPADTAEISDLDGWAPGLGLELKKQRSDGALLVGGIAKLTFVSDNVKGSLQRGFRGPRGSVLLTAVRLKDRATARAFFAEIARIPESSVSLSVRSELGDGAHWFFRHRGRTCRLWVRGPWFLAVETRLDAANATPAQERRFSDQVVNAFRKGLPR